MDIISVHVWPQFPPDSGTLPMLFYLLKTLFQHSLCNGLNVCVSPNSYVENLTSKRVVLRDRVFEGVECD